MNCKRCGNIINNNAKFCNICGEKNNNKEVTEIINQPSLTNNSKKISIIYIASIVLMFFVGFFIGKNIDNKKYGDNLNEQLNGNNNIEKDDGIKKYTHNLFVPSEVEKVKNNTELGKNVTIDEIFFNPNYNSYSKYKDAIFYGKNNNSIPVEIKLILEYYDSEGYRIEKGAHLGTIVQPGKEFVTNITIEDDALNYSKVKLSYEVNKLKSYYTNVTENYVTITSNVIDNNNINILVENNYTKKINGNIACLYYKDNKLVFAQYAAVFGVEANQKSIANCYAHKLYLNEDYSNLQKIEYDDFKVVLYSTYNNDTTNY